MEINEKEYEKLNRKLDFIIGMLSSVLVEADYVSKVAGLNRQTISQNDNLEKFQEIGKRKLLISLRTATVVANRKRGKKRNRK